MYLYGEDPLEEGMEIHYSILNLESPRDRGVWWATVRRGHRVRHNGSNLASISLSLYKVKKISLKGGKKLLTLLSVLQWRGREKERRK